jgi:hypothetical protein
MGMGAECGSEWDMEGNEDARGLRWIFGACLRGVECREDGCPMTNVGNDDYRWIPD